MIFQKNIWTFICHCSVSFSLLFHPCFSALQTAAPPPVAKLVSEACLAMNVWLPAILLTQHLFMSNLSFYLHVSSNGFTAAIYYREWRFTVVLAYLCICSSCGSHVNSLQNPSNILNQNVNHKHWQAHTETNGPYVEALPACCNCMFETRLTQSCQHIHTSIAAAVTRMCREALINQSVQCARWVCWCVGIFIGNLLTALSWKALCVPVCVWVWVCLSPKSWFSDSPLVHACQHLVAKEGRWLMRTN